MCNFKSCTFLDGHNWKLIHHLNSKPLLQSQLNFSWTRPRTQGFVRGENEYVVEAHGLWNHAGSGWIVTLPQAMWLKAAHCNLMSIVFVIYIMQRTYQYHQHKYRCLDLLNLKGWDQDIAKKKTWIQSLGVHIGRVENHTIKMFMCDLMK